MPSVALQFRAGAGTFLYATAFRPGLWHPPALLWAYSVYQGLFPSELRPKREVNHFLLSCAKVRNTWSYLHSPLGPLSLWRGAHRNNFGSVVDALSRNIIIAVESFEGAKTLAVPCLNARRGILYVVTQPRRRKCRFVIQI
jgi:hypothetical protein